jgi:RNA polymerase sigma-70 factor, ECF subfamily
MKGSMLPVSGVPTKTPTILAVVAKTVETDPSTTGELTELLHAWRAGDGSSGDRLIAALYSELHALAGRQMRRENAGTLATTALVHEAYLRLLDQRRTDWQDRRHFLAIAATTMRRVLIDRARARHSLKRGVDLVDLSRIDRGGAERNVELLDLDHALDHLAALHPRQARVVELRFFGGLEEREIAEIVGVGERTVRRDWVFAAAWLERALAGDGS